MRLVACRSCHAQFDVTGVDDPEFRCHCGAVVRNVAHDAIDARIRRCASCGAALTDGQARCEFCGSTVERDQRRLGLICPECFARNAEGTRFCTSCGIRFRPQPVAAPGEERSCPCCECHLPVRSIGGIRVYECPVCNGLWVPGESFELLVRHACAAAQPAAALGGGGKGRRRRSQFDAKVEYRRCPVCHTPMLRRNYGSPGRRSGIIVDWCGEHGTWLDADELEDIAAFITRGGGNRAAAGAGREAAPTLPGAAERRRTVALVEAESRLAAQRSRRTRRAAHLFGRHAAGGLRLTLGDLFEKLLDW